MVMNTSEFIHDLLTQCINRRRVYRYNYLHRTWDPEYAYKTADGKTQYIDHNYQLYTLE